MTETQTKTEIRHVYGNVMKIAIPLTIRIRTLEDGRETETEEPFYPNPAYPVTIRLFNNFATVVNYTAAMSDNVALIEDDGSLPVGVYQVEVLCHDLNGNPFRYMVRSIVKIVDATADAGIEAGIEFNAETYTLEGAVFFYAKGAVFTPHLDNEGNLSWTNDGGYENPETKNIKGPQGVSVVNVEQIQTSHESSGVNVVRVTLSNGQTFDFEVTNGERVSPVYDPETESLIF